VRRARLCPTQRAQFAHLMSSPSARPPTIGPEHDRPARLGTLHGGRRLPCGRARRCNRPRRPGGIESPVGRYAAHWAVCPSAQSLPPPSRGRSRLVRRTGSSVAATSPRLARRLPLLPRCDSALQAAPRWLSRERPMPDVHDARRARRRTPRSSAGPHHPDRTTAGNGEPDLSAPLGGSCPWTQAQPSRHERVDAPRPGWCA
jgi:hypothetical protein